MKPALIGLVALAVSLPAFAGGDADKGADSFDTNCAECHSVAKTLKNKKGPSLYGIVGRPAASIVGFDYSQGLKDSKITWTPEQIDTYLIAPKKLVPGGKMKFDGLSSAAERADLLAFLAAQK